MMAEYFYMGGASMWLIAVIGLEALVAAILHASFARRWSFILSAAHLPLPLAIGVAGWLLGLHAVSEAIAYAGYDAFTLAEIEAQGNAEARVPLIFGAVFFAVCLIPFSIGCARRAKRAA
jgi:hypothetical protein